jgi:hypothetical protein
MHRAWYTLNCVASENGTLPPDVDIAAVLRVRVGKVHGWVEALLDVGLLEVVDKAVRPVQLEPESDRLCASQWAELSSEVFRRDDYTCTYCGARGGRLECDHVHPLSRGGSNEIGNLTTACFGCNRSKMTKTLQEWMS